MGSKWRNWLHHPGYIIESLPLRTTCKLSFLLAATSIIHIVLHFLSLSLTPFPVRLLSLTLPQILLLSLTHPSPDTLIITRHAFFLYFVAQKMHLRDSSLLSVFSIYDVEPGLAGCNLKTIYYQYKGMGVFTPRYQATPTIPVRTCATANRRKPNLGRLPIGKRREWFLTTRHNLFHQTCNMRFLSENACNMRWHALSGMLIGLTLNSLYL